MSRPRNPEKVTERSIRFPDTLYIQGMERAAKMGISFPELMRLLLEDEISHPRIAGIG